MTDTTPAADRPADLLRAAAELLRQTATTAGGEPWVADHFPEGTIVRPAATTHSLFRLAAHGNRAAGTPCVSPAVGAHIALMHPGVGLALARLLDGVMSTSREADHEECQRGCSPEICDLSAALAVARQLLGTTETEGARCVCGDPIEWMTHSDGSGWIHSPGSETRCLDARPAAPSAPADRAATPSPSVLAELMGTIRDLQALQQPLVNALRHIREDMHRAWRGGDEWAMEWMSDVWAELPLQVRAAGGDPEAVHELATAGVQPPTTSTDQTEGPEDTVRRFARRLHAVELLCSGRPGYHTVTVKQLLTAMGEADDEQPAAPAAPEEPTR
ncbi:MULTISPECIES: hypothetical protein [unclassified Streptomyces]|uniref:hypothetical protein n=1 Tax=unclassified Streptomyces TaxID=2593676 RepID=UPI000CD4F0B9|nr:MULTISPECIES: hypothetical protein [unclassified Streptomyces]AWL39692.1 hypothetical protein B9S64_17520 [Streptomyces sp. SM18]